MWAWLPCCEYFIHQLQSHFHSITCVGYLTAFSVEIQYVLLQRDTILQHCDSAKLTPRSHNRRPRLLGSPLIMPIRAQSFSAQVLVAAPQGLVTAAHGLDAASQGLITAAQGPLTAAQGLDATTHDDQEQRPFRFLDLPAEIRITVYVSYSLNRSRTVNIDDSHSESRISKSRVLRSIQRPARQTDIGSGHEIS